MMSAAYLGLGRKGRVEIGVGPVMDPEQKRNTNWVRKVSIES